MKLRGHVVKADGISYTPKLESPCGTISITIYPSDVNSLERQVSKVFGFQTAKNARRSAKKKALLLGASVAWHPFDEVTNE